MFSQAMCNSYAGSQAIYDVASAYGSSSVVAASSMSLDSDSEAEDM